MSKSLTFGSTVVDIPLAGDAPSWAEGVSDSLEAIADVLATVAGIYDVPAQSQVIDASNPGAPDVDITALNFPINNVRAVIMSYAVYRTTDSTTAYEAGTLISAYSPGNATNSKWETSRDYVGDGKISFYVTDVGQVQYTATAIAGSSHVGKLIFSAKAILQS